MIPDKDNATNIDLEQIYSIQELNELKDTVKAVDEDLLRKVLTKTYLQLVEYNTAEEWNRLVRICEVFSIIGWGNLERVNANCIKSLNHWHTELRNVYDETRFLKGNWVKRKNGYVLFNPSYYYSPDKPNKPTVDWNDYPKKKEIESLVSCLQIQRNKQKMNPISFGGIYVFDSTVSSAMLSPILYDLMRMFDYNLNPDSYGEGIDTIGLRCITTKQGERAKSQVERGVFYPKKEAYYCDVLIGDEFADFSERERKEEIKNLLGQILEQVKIKVKKSKLTYDVDLLSTDVMKIVNKWIGITNNEN